MDEIRRAKAELRRLARSRPAADEPEAAAVLRHLDVFLRGLGDGTCVLAYLPLPGEIDLSPLVRRHPRLRWVTTRTPDSGGLTIHPFDSPRERHRYGFEQPVPEAPRVEPSEVDVVLAPGLAFDPLGHRLGRGLGYYDRLLADIGHCVRVGVTLERLIVPDVPVEGFDVDMTLLATELGVSPAGPPTSR